MLLLVLVLDPFRRVLLGEESLYFWADAHFERLKLYFKHFDFLCKTLKSRFLQQKYIIPKSKFLLNDYLSI